MYIFYWFNFHTLKVAANYHATSRKTAKRTALHNVRLRWLLAQSQSNRWSRCRRHRHRRRCHRRRRQFALNTRPWKLKLALRRHREVSKKASSKTILKAQACNVFFFSCYDFKYVILVCFVFVRILLWLLFLRVCFISRLIGVDSLWSENNLWIFLFFCGYFFLSVEFVSICHGIFYDLCDFCWKLTQICSNNLNNNNNSNNSNNNKRRPQGKKSQQQLQWTGGRERERGK